MRYCLVALCFCFPVFVVANEPPIVAEPPVVCEPPACYVGPFSLDGITLAPVCPPAGAAVQSSQAFTYSADVGSYSADEGSSFSTVSAGRVGVFGRIKANRACRVQCRANNAATRTVCAPTRTVTYSVPAQSYSVCAPQPVAQVNYQTVMESRTVTRLVPQTETVMEPRTITRLVPQTETVQVPVMRAVQAAAEPPAVSFSAPQVSPQFFAPRQRCVIINGQRYCYPQ